MKVWLHVLNLQNTHRQLLLIRGCWTDLKFVEKEREIEMWRKAVAPPHECEYAFLKSHVSKLLKLLLNFRKKD